MLLKYLLVAALFYFIVKTSRNLIRAVRGELDGPSYGARFGHPPSDGPTRRSGWRQDTPRTRSTRPHERWEEDIEDAKWEDL